MSGGREVAVINTKSFETFRTRQRPVPEETFPLMSLIFIVQLLGVPRREYVLLLSVLVGKGLVLKFGLSSFR